MAAILLAAGIIGRQITHGQAGKTDDLPIFLGLSTLAGRFENLLVRPASLVVIIARGYPGGGRRLAGFRLLTAAR